MRSSRLELLLAASGTRLGLVPTVDFVEATMADLPGFANAVTSFDSGLPDDDTTGGVATTRELAAAAAIGEALERYAASTAPLPLLGYDELPRRAEVLSSSDFGLFTAEQTRTPEFPWPAADARLETYTAVYSLHDNHEHWVPQELVGLGSRVDPPRMPSTSTGLAASTDRLRALLGGLEEVLERDALASTWLNALPGRRLELDEARAAPVRSRGGRVEAFELTQAWNPHPVIAVAGQLPLRGWPRQSFGVACRRTREEAVDAAYREWYQGVLFVGYHLDTHPGLCFPRVAELRTFVHHGVYFGAHPERWAEVPLLAPAPPPPPRAPEGPPTSIASTLEALVAALGRAGLRLFYRDLTLPDVARLGVTVVRVLCPDLSLLHADERAPFLGGRLKDTAWRYPGLAPAGPFPNRLPHPLG